MKKVLILLLAISFASPAIAKIGAEAPSTVLITSGQFKLKALLWKPKGQGPFPAVLFNHGSWPTTYRSGRPTQDVFQQATTLGPIFSRHGFVFLFLFRRGTGLSVGQGVSAADRMATELSSKGQEARNRLQLQLLDTDELSDALAGLAYLRTLPEINTQHIAVAGHSFGGALTLLIAERDSHLFAAVDFAGAAGSWESSAQLRTRLLTAVGSTKIPIFFIHSENDYSVAPGKALAAEMALLGKPYLLKIYPPFGSSSSVGHNLVDMGVATWETDVFKFLGDQLHR